MELLNTKQINKFGIHYLLGEDAEGTRHWLEVPSWDCGWYWGGLYIHTFTNNRQPTRSVDINSHRHFDSMFLEGDYSNYKNFFKKSTLSQDEIWRLLELARTFYTLKDSAGLFEKGSSWVSKNDCYDVIKDQKLYLEIVKVKLPAVISAICNLLGGNTTPEQFSKEVVYKDE